MQPPYRISMIGTTGSGKTTTARAVAERLAIPHFELDALFWGPNWSQPPDDVFFSSVSNATAQEQWVIDGNYTRTRHLVWERANTVIYLDYGFLRVLWQLLNRTLRRAFTQEELWSGNIEHPGRILFDRDSILYYMLRTYHRRRRQYACLFQEPQYAHLQIIHLKSPRMQRAWFQTLPTDKNQ